MKLILNLILKLKNFKILNKNIKKYLFEMADIFGIFHFYAIIKKI